MTGTVRTMGQVSTTLAWLVVLHGVNVFRLTGSYFSATIEAFVMLAMAFAIALRFA